MSELQPNNSPVVVDRLSDLPQPILLHILSFLPTKFAIRVSSLSQHYRHLWTASPTVDLNCRDFRHGQAFAFSTYRCFHLRDRSAPLARFRLKSDCSRRNIPLTTASNWLRSAYALGLRDLDLEIHPDEFEPLFPLILTFHSLQSLKITCFNLIACVPPPHQLNSVIPDNFRATGLRSLHLETWIPCSDLKRFVMEQNILEDLCLNLPMSSPLDLVSHTVKTAKLSFQKSRPEIISLFFPALEVLKLDMLSLRNLKKFQPVMPSLRKANCFIPDVSVDDVPVLNDMLRCFQNVSQLAIHIRERKSRHPKKYLDEYQFHPLKELGKDLPIFPHLKDLKLSMHFHEYGISDLICFLRNSPVLESVELDHVCLCRACWKSKLPLDSEGNNQHAHFSNLHEGDKRDKVIRLLRSEMHGKKLKI